MQEIGKVGQRGMGRRWLNIASDGADVTCGGRLFQTLVNPHATNLFHTFI